MPSTPPSAAQRKFRFHSAGWLASLLCCALFAACSSNGTADASDGDVGDRSSGAGRDAGRRGAGGSAGSRGAGGGDAGSADGADARARPDARAGGRDWGARPAVVQVGAPGASSAIYAMSDIHGGYDRMVALLAKNKLIAKAPATPDGVTWSAGASVLVVAGDLIDKGPKPLEVIELLSALESSAAAAGGRVVVTLGNHEAELIVDPNNAKASKDDGINAELKARGIAPADVASGKDPHGRWLRTLPFAARVGKWFFSHAGDTHGRSVVDLETIFRAAVDTKGYNDPNVIGDDSILESRDWYASDATMGSRYAKAVGALHIVFGHQPSALGPKGSIALAQNGALFRIDCGMSPGVDYSQGALLRVRHAGSEDVADSLEATGVVRELWRGPGG